MSANKYAGLPDIDTAPDIYETDDPPPPPPPQTKEESSDDEFAYLYHKKEERPTKEELDTSSVGHDVAGKTFRKLEKKNHRPRIQYVYTTSDTEDTERTSPDPAHSTLALPLFQRLKRLQAEIASLETELEDPSNPLLVKECDPGELIRGMVDVKGRLEKISKIKEGRGKLVSVVLGEVDTVKLAKMEAIPEKDSSKDKHKDEETKHQTEAQDLAEVDKRVGRLEKIIGSSDTALDELSPLPPPMLPLLQRLNNQLTLLTQPRHIDSISRRLKILLADLERASNPNPQQQGKKGSLVVFTSKQPTTPSASAQVANQTLQEQITPILHRLNPMLPHIPHILARLRTLSVLHTQAAAFQSTLENLEEEQKRARTTLQDLQRAVEGVEKSWKENEEVVKKNVLVLEEKVFEVQKKLDSLAVSRDTEDI